MPEGSLSTTPSHREGLVPLHELGVGREGPHHPCGGTGWAGEWEGEAGPGLVGSWGLAGSQGDSVQTGKTGWGWSSRGEGQEAGPGPEWSFLASQPRSCMDLRETQFLP